MVDMHLYLLLMVLAILLTFKFLVQLERDREVKKAIIAEYEHNAPNKENMKKSSEREEKAYKAEEE